MNLLQTLKIGPRLALLSAVLLLLMVALSAAAFVATDRMYLQAKKIYGQNVLSLQKITELERLTQRNRVLVADALHDPTPENIQTRSTELLANEQHLDQLLAQYSAGPKTDAERQAEAAFDAAMQAYIRQAKLPVMEALLAGQREQAYAIYQAHMTDKARQVALTLRALVEIETNQAREQYEAINATHNAITVLLIVGVLLGLLLGGLLSWAIARSITQPLQRALQVAETVASGDLSSRIEAAGRDEAAQLLRALAVMNANLARLVAQVYRSADSIDTGASEIASGNADLSQRTEQQASSLEQTAASMEQLTATVKQNAETARAASQIAAGASAAAEQGGAVVGRVVGTMQEISASSQKIADIIGVIDGIAFQTNILALNAAVEAARAGEQGRGFAVVASEVRSLAGRSAEAAKEIKELIGASVQRVEQGSQLVAQAGQSVGEIVSQVKRVTDLIAEISAASNEQSEGIGQIGQAVQQLDHATQQNAALVEQSAAASESLKGQAAHLIALVGQFKLDQGDVGRGAGGAAAPARTAPAPRAAVPAAYRAAPPAASAARGAGAAAASRAAPAGQSGSASARMSAPRPAAAQSRLAPPARALPPTAKPKAEAEGDWTSF
jgi:methyl-accepting chemotaxis protein-1 (serine sensor receptor)